MDDLNIQPQMYIQALNIYSTMIYIIVCLVTSIYAYLWRLFQSINSPKAENVRVRVQNKSMKAQFKKGALSYTPCQENKRLSSYLVMLAYSWYLFLAFEFVTVK